MKFRTSTVCIILAVAVLAFFLPHTRRAAAQTQNQIDPYALLDAVNVYRQARSMYAFQVNPALMNSAQAHSVHQATIGVSSHTGAGGTTVTQRAQAAGYGSGSTIECNENLAYGSGLTSDAVIQSWSSGENLANILSASFLDAGVGASTAANGTVYYTLNLCYVAAGQPVVGIAGTPASTSDPNSLIPLSTPLPDGSIIHIVQPGENLVLIAQAYSISLAELFALNNLTKDSAIYPDQKLIIRVANTATPTSYFTATPTAYTPEPTSTRRPTRTPTPPPSATAPAPTPTPTPMPDGFSPDQIDTLLIGSIIATLGSGMLFILIGLVLRLRR